MAQARFGKCSKAPLLLRIGKGAIARFYSNSGSQLLRTLQTAPIAMTFNSPALTAHFNPLLTKQKMARASLEFGSTGVHAMGFLRENLIHNTCPRTGNIRLRRPCGCFHGKMIQLARVPISAAICVRKRVLSTQTPNETETARTAV